jgi:hypothetical protein
LPLRARIAFVFRAAVKPIPGGCGQNFLVLYAPENKLNPRTVRTTMHGIYD